MKLLTAFGVVAVLDGTVRPLIKICDFGYSKVTAHGAETLITLSDIK